MRMELEQLVQSLQKRADRLERKQRRFLAATGRRISVGRMANRSGTARKLQNAWFVYCGLCRSSEAYFRRASAKPSRGRKDSGAARARELSLAIPQAMNAAALGYSMMAA